MHARGVAIAVVLLLAASSAVALDPSEWSGDSNVLVHSFRQGVTRGGDWMTWTDEGQPVLSVDSDRWTLRGNLTGGLSGTLVPSGRVLYRARASGDGFVEWASRIVSPRSMLDSGANDIFVQAGDLRGTLRVDLDGSDARLLLRGNWRGIVIGGQEIGRTRRGTIRVSVHGDAP